MAGETPAAGEPVVFQLPDGRVVQGAPDKVEALTKAFPGARAMDANEVAAYDAAQAQREQAGGVRGAVEEFGARALQSLTPLGLFPVVQNIEQLTATAVPVAKALAARVAGDASEEARQQDEASKALERVQQYQRTRSEEHPYVGGAGELAGLAGGMMGLKAATNMAAAASPAAAKAAKAIASSAGFNGLEALTSLTQTSAAAGEALTLAQRTKNLLARGAAIGAGMTAQELAREEATSKDHLAGSYIASELAKGALSGVAVEGLLGAAGKGVESLVGKFGPETVAKYGGGALAGTAGYTAASMFGAGEPISALVGAAAAYKGGTAAANAVRSFTEARQIAAARETLDKAMRDDLVGTEAVTPKTVPTADQIAASRATPAARKQTAEALMRRYEELEGIQPQTAQEVAALEAERDAIEHQISLTALEDDAATAAQQKFDASQIRRTIAAATDEKNPARGYMREQLHELGEQAAQDTTEAVKAYTDTLKGQEVTQVEGYGLSKRNRFRQLAEADAVPFEAAQDVAVSKLAEIEQRIGKLAEGTTKETKALWKQQKEAVRTTLDQIAALEGKEATAGDVMALMDDWKRQGQREIAQALKKKSVIGTDAQAFNGFRNLVDDDVRIWLENTAEFGERATALQRELNVATTNAITNREALAAAMATKFDRNAFDAYRPGFEADSAKVNALLSKMSGAENATLRKLVETQNARELQLANVMKANFDLPAASAAKLDAQIAAHERLAELFQRASKRSIMQEALAAAEKTSAAAMAAEAAGNMSQAASAAKALLMLQSNMMRERAVARIAQRVSDRIESVVQAVVKARTKETSRVVGAEIARAVTGREKPARGTGGARPRVEGTAKPARAATQKALESIAAPKGTTQLTQAAKRAATVVALNQSPQLLQKAIMGSVGAHYDEQNPTLYDATAVAAAKGFAYLQRNMPPGLKGMAQGNTQQVPQVSDAELAAWNRRVQAVQDPLSVLKDIESGAVTRDQAEALRVVHPAIYQSIHDKLIEAVANAKTPVPYAQRVMFFTLFDAPVDRTLDRGVVQLLQQNFQPRQAAAPAVPRMPAGRTFSANMRTRADTIGQR